MLTIVAVVDTMKTTNAQIQAHCYFCPYTLLQLGSSTVAALYVQQRDSIDTLTQEIELR